jgi:hypothetical protein
VRLRQRLRELRRRPARLPTDLSGFDPGPFDDGEFESRLAWILGSPRTGSTWLMRLLIYPLRPTNERPWGSTMPRRASVQPVAVPINEPYLAHHLTPTLEGFTEPGARISVLNSMRSGDPSYFFSDAFARWWRPEVRRLILVRLHAQAELAAREHSLANPLVVVKEPNGAHGADFLMSILGTSRMLFLLRDGRDVVDSMLDAQSDGGWLAGLTPVESELQRLEFVRRRSRLWVIRTMTVQRAFDAHPPQLRFRVRYEDLRENTLAALRAIVDWLELDRSDEQLQAAVDALNFESYPSRAKGPGKALRAASPGLWRENMSEPEQEAMSEIMGKPLEALGYET